MQNFTHVKKCTLLLFGLLLMQLSAWAQDSPIKFGKVTEEELKMKAYDKDTSAAAVVLGDYGRSYFTYNRGFKLMFERVTRIKILKKSGYEWANFVVPFYQKDADKEVVYGVKGMTYNLEDGKVVKVKMDDKAIFTEKESENWSNKKFTLPAVKEGSVIEVTYTISSDFFFNFRDWVFQYPIPVVYSEYRASIPEYFEYKNYMQGYEPMQIAESVPGMQKFTVTWSASIEGGLGGRRTPGGSETVDARNMNHRWVMKDLPAISTESYITTLGDYIAKIEFELEWIRWPHEVPKRVAGTWEKLTEEFLTNERFGLQLNRTGFFKNEITALQSVKDSLEKVNAIYNFVKKNVKWNGRSGVLATTTLRKAFDTKTGNAADINLMLVSMLREAGIEAYPVVLSTRNHGRVPQYAPLLSKFNYVVAYARAGGKEMLLDATDPYLPIGMLPKNCLNGQGWLIAKGQGTWVPLQGMSRGSEVLSADLQLSSLGVLMGKVQESSSGMAAWSLRRAVQEAGESKFLEQWTKAQSQYERKKPVMKNLDNVNQSLGVEYEIASLDNDAAQPLETIYLNPMLLRAKVENPFKHNDRKYPVDFAHPTEETYICNITIPDGYVVEEMPKSMMMSLPENGGKFTYMMQVTGNKIQVMSKLSITRPVFYAEEYSALQQFYSQVIAKHAEQIVLKKKG